MQFVSYLGGLVTLALIFSAVGGVIKALVVCVWDLGLQNKQASTDEAFLAMLDSLLKLIRFFQARMLATGFSVVMLLVSFAKESDFSVSMGYAAIVFAIVGLAAPFVFRFIRASALCFAIRSNSFSGISD